MTFTVKCHLLDLLYMALKKRKKPNSSLSYLSEDYKKFSEFLLKVLDKHSPLLIMKMTTLKCLQEPMLILTLCF